MSLFILSNEASLRKHAKLYKSSRTQGPQGFLPSSKNYHFLKKWSNCFLCQTPNHQTKFERHEYENLPTSKSDTKVLPTCKGPCCSNCTCSSSTEPKTSDGANALTAVACELACELTPQRSASFGHFLKRTQDLGQGVWGFTWWVFSSWFTAKHIGQSLLSHCLDCFPSCQLRTLILLCNRGPTS